MDKRFVVLAVNTLGIVCLVKVPQVAFHHMHLFCRRDCSFKEPAHEDTSSKTRSVGGIRIPHMLILDIMKYWIINAFHISFFIETILAAGTPHIYFLDSG
ncbi:unnamed protein product, partial [Bubo scandiacus]